MVGIKSVSIESLNIVNCSSVKYITIFLQSCTRLNATYNCPWLEGGEVMSRSNLNRVWDQLLLYVMAYTRRNLSIFLVLLCCYVVGCHIWSTYLLTVVIFLCCCVVVLLYCHVVVLLCCCVVVLLCCCVVIMLSDVHTCFTLIYLRYMLTMPTLPTTPTSPTMTHLKSFYIPNCKQRRTEWRDRNYVSI